MGCKGSKNHRKGPRPGELTPQLNPLRESGLEGELQVGVGCLSYSDPALLEHINTSRSQEASLDESYRSRSASFSSDEGGNQQLNARLAALIIQRRSDRRQARTPLRPTAVFNQNSAMPNVDLALKPRRNSLSRSSSKVRSPTKVKFDVVHVHEFARDYTCSCSQPSSGGLPLGMGMYHVQSSRTNLNEFEDRRALERIPMERFHITGRLSPMERSRMLGQKKK